MTLLAQRGERDLVRLSEARPAREAVLRLAIGRPRPRKAER